MAVVDVEFIATANFSSLVAQTKMANASLAQLQKTTAAINAEKIAGAFSTFTSSLTNSGRFTSQMVNVTNSTNAFGKSLMAGKLTFAEYKRELSAFVAQREGMIDRLAAQNVRMAESTVIARGINPSTGQAMAQVVTSTGALSTSAATQAAFAAQRIQVLNKVLLQASTSMINWGKNTQWAGRQMMVGLTMPLLVIGGLAAKTYYDFSKELTRFVKVYGNGVSELSAAAVKSMEEQVTGLAMEFQKTLGVAMKQTAELAGLMAQAGYEGEKLTSGMRDVTRLSILGAVDMTTAWKAYQSVQNVFHRTSAQMTDDINFFSGVESTTSLSLQDITASIPKAAPVIKSLGGDIKDLTGYMVAMREGGVPAAEAANTLKTSLARLIAPTRQTKEMFKSFGIDIQGIVQKNAGHLTDMLLALQKALDKLDPTQRAIAIQQAFGKQRFANVTALFNNLYREGSQSAKALEFAGYTAAERAILAAREIYKVQNTDAYKLKRSWGEILVDLSKFGQKFLAVTTKVVQGIGQVFKFFDKFPKAFKEFGMGALIFVAFVGPVVMLTGVIGNFIGSITKGLVHLRMLASGSKNVWAPMTPEMKAAETMAEKFNSALLMQTDNVEVLNTAMKTLIGTLNEVAIAQKAASGPIISPMSTPVGRSTAAAMAIMAKGRTEAGHGIASSGMQAIAAPFKPQDKAPSYKANLPGGLSLMRENKLLNQGGGNVDKSRNMSLFGPGQAQQNFKVVSQQEAALAASMVNVRLGIARTGTMLSTEAQMLSRVGGELLLQADAEIASINGLSAETEGKLIANMRKGATDVETAILEKDNAIQLIFQKTASDVVEQSGVMMAEFFEISKMSDLEVVQALKQNSLLLSKAFKDKSLGERAAANASYKALSEQIGVDGVILSGDIQADNLAISQALEKGTLDARTALAVQRDALLAAANGQKIFTTSGGRIDTTRFAGAAAVGQYLPGGPASAVIGGGANERLVAATTKSADIEQRRAAIEQELIASEEQLIAANQLMVEATDSGIFTAEELAVAEADEAAALARYTAAVNAGGVFSAELEVAQEELAAATFAAAPAVDRLAAPAAELTAAQETLAAASAELALLTEDDVTRRAELQAMLTAATEGEIEAAAIKAEQDIKSAEVEKTVMAAKIKSILATEGLTREQMLSQLVLTNVLTEEQALKLGTRTLTEKRIMAAASTTGGGGGGMGRGMGASMGIGMGMMAGSMFTHGNTQKALMGGSMLVMMAPMLAGIGLIGGLVLAIAAAGVALFMLYKHWKKSHEESNTWMRSSKKSAEELGYKFHDLTVPIQAVGDTSSAAEKKVHKLVESLKQAPADDPLKIIAEDWKNDTDNVETLTKAVAFYQLQLARGVNPEAIRVQIASLLELSGKKNLAVEIDLRIKKVNVKDTAGNMTAALDEAAKNLIPRNWGDDLGSYIKGSLGVLNGIHGFNNTQSVNASNELLNQKFDSTSLKTYTETFGQLVAQNKELSPENWQKFIAGINNSQANKTLTDTDVGLRQVRQSFLDTLNLNGDPDWQAVDSQIKTMGDYANATALALSGMNGALAASLGPSQWGDALASMNVFRSAVAANEAAANKDLAKQIKHTPGSTAAVGADPYKAQKDANDAKIEHENKIIKAIEKRKTAEQKAFDAKKKQDDYEKKRFDDQIGYREALASGDFGAAARIASNMANDAAQNRKELEHQRRQDAYQNQIDTHQGTIDKLNEVNKGLDKLTEKSQAAAATVQDQYDTNLATASADMATLTEYMFTHSKASTAQMLRDNKPIAKEIESMGLNVGKFFQTAKDNYTGALTTQTDSLRAQAANITDAEIKLLTDSSQVAALAAYIAGVVKGGGNPTADMIQTWINQNNQVTAAAAARNAAPKNGSSGQQLAAYYTPGHPRDWSFYQSDWGFPPSRTGNAPKDQPGGKGGHWVNSGLTTDNGFKYWYWQKYHTGGKITGNSDEVPILAQRGEYMINAKAAKKLGVDRLDMINTGELPKYHTGGQIKFNGLSGADTSVKYYMPPAAQAHIPSATGGTASTTASTPATAPATTPATAPATPPIPSNEPPVVHGSLGKFSAQQWAKHHTTSDKHYPGINPINQHDNAGKGNWPFYLNPGGKMGKWHSGNDFPASVGTPVFSLSAGKVKVARNTGSGYGNFVVITDTDKKVTRGYAHLDTIEWPLRVARRGGVNVARGEKVGTVGRSGFDVGSNMFSHLHYEIHPGNVSSNAFGNGGGGKKWKESLNPSAFINNSTWPANVASQPMAGHHIGGPVQKMQSDDVHRILQAGEYVVQKSAVNRVGTATLDAINSGQQIATGSQSSYNITVNGVPGMDVNEIASKVVQKIELKEKRKGLARN